MADPRFFHHCGSLTLDALAQLTGATVSQKTDGGRRFQDVAALSEATAEQVSFLDNTHYLDEFSVSKAGACFVREKFASRAPAGMVLLLTEEPYTAYAIACANFYKAQPKPASISPAAHIAKSATLGANVAIAPGVVIGENVTIGKNTVIDANTVIADGVVIGDDCRIGALCSISHTLMKNRVTLHRGVHIGQDGFGFAPSAKGIMKVPQLGRVLIEDDVEIGSGSCIDRGAAPDTVIGMGSKIDNLVQIGHNVRLGKFVVIAAQCGLSGSTQVGDGAMLGGQVGLAGHLRIGARARIAAQSGVMTDVPDGASFGGAPAQPIRDWHRQTVAVAKLVSKKE